MASPHVVPPVALADISPEYPSDLSVGPVDVHLVITIGADGHLMDAVVSSVDPADADARFASSALEAARGASFEPATRDGVPIAIRVRYIVHFVPPAAPVTPPTAESRESAEPTPSDAAPSEAGAEPDARERARMDEPEDTPVLQATAYATAPPIAASDYHQTIGALGSVPQSNAAGFLRLAPGILLTNEGGDGHAERVYLRGFDAHEGQDLEFLVNGIPFNEVGNPHGEGYAETHFIIPELVESIRVLEGPFDPRQGNYAVAGSAEYRLGLPEAGTQIRTSFGNYGSQRLLALWGRGGGHAGTFAGADVERSAGFGSNRASSQARVMGQYAISLSDSLELRVFAFAHATRYASAGVLRADDHESGRVGFFDTYDRTQGGDNTRTHLGVVLEDRSTFRTLRQQIFLGYRTLRIRANFTGFVEDPIAPWRSGTAQRGDAVDQTYGAFTIGGRGSARRMSLWHGRAQALEVGYYARFDGVDSGQRRLRAGTDVPYRIDFDRGMSISNLGLYADVELRPIPKVTVRGGLRADYFLFQVDDHCALHETTLGGGIATPLDVLCYSRDRLGARDPSQRITASGATVEPRTTLTVGPFSGFSLAASFGRGTRAADPSYVADGSRAPFVRIDAAEVGVMLDRRVGDASLRAHLTGYYTHTGNDLIFNQQEGRNALAPGTVRAGALVAARITGSWFDWAASATYANARFRRSTSDPSSSLYASDLGTRVLYVPSWVVRSDAAVHGRPRFIPPLAGKRVEMRAALGVTYVSPRPLPFGESSQRIFVVDASSAVRWSLFEIGVSVQNLFDTHYRQAEFNYVSDFVPNNPVPNLVATRMFSAGAPLTVLATLAVHWGDDAVEEPSAAAPADAESSSSHAIAESEEP